MKPVLLITVLLLTAATCFGQSGDFGKNNALHWEIETVKIINN
jgi:hypothetical protein